MRQRIILASGSPRRIMLLKKAGVKFRAVESDFKETVNKKLKPSQMVRVLSMGKAKAVAKKYPDRVVIGADTIVVFKGKVLGKPHTPQKARQMLKFLSGSAHYVYTGFTVISPSGKAVTKAQRTKVCFREISIPEIEEYVKTGEPLDRAGAYAIQGGAGKFVDKIVGDYDNVVGLPVKPLQKILNKLCK